MKTINLILSITLVLACKSKTVNESAMQDSIRYPDRQQISINEATCKYKDSTYTATVNYHNSRTGHSSTYTLDVVVKNCKVVRINFPNGGWLDEDHMNPAIIEDNEIARVACEGGKTYVIDLSEQNLTN